MTTYGVIGTGAVATRIIRDLESRGRAVTVVDPAGAAAATAEEFARLDGLDVVIEAVVEDYDEKLVVLRALAPLRIGAVLTTTSTYTVRQLAEDAAIGPRLAGFHILPEAHEGGLAEIAGGEQADPGVLAAAATLAETLGVPALNVPDIPGRLTRRLLVPFLNQALDLYGRGVADAADIDRVVELGLGHAAGPLRSLSQSGVDDHRRVSRQLAERLGDSRFAVPASCKETDLEDVGAMARDRGRYS